MSYSGRLCGEAAELKHQEEMNGVDKKLQQHLQLAARGLEEISGPCGVTGRKILRHGRKQS